MAKKARVYDGTAWQELASAQTDLTNYYTKSQSDAITPPGAWTSFTPTWTNLTVGNGTYEVAAYNLIGKTAIVTISFIFGSTSSISGDVKIILPANLARKTATAGNGICFLGDAGTANYIGTCNAEAADAKNWFIRPINAAGTYAVLGALSSTIPMTWGVGDSIKFTLTFEVA